MAGADDTSAERGDNGLSAARLLYVCAVTLEGRASLRSDASHTLIVPPAWTIWLLMHKAGVPHALIAEVSEAEQDHVRGRIFAAHACMLWAPYGARIERLMREMPRMGGGAEVVKLKALQGGKKGRAA